MSRNIVPRINKGADLGTSEKNWNKLYADAVVLRGNDLNTMLDNKLNVNSVRQGLTGNVVVSVGNTGDFPTINAALEDIVASYYPKYISNSNSTRVTINLLPGFVMNEQVLIESIDLSWITIAGVDDETIIDRSKLTRSFFNNVCPAFGAYNGGFLPIIGQLFNMNTLGASAYRYGIDVYYNSTAIVLPNCGVKNAGDIGVCARSGSTIVASNTNFSGAGSHGIHAVSISAINADNADASGAGQRAVFAYNGSVINANNANISGAGNGGIRSENGSMVNAWGVDASESPGIAVIHGSIINAYNSTGSLNQTPNIVTYNGIIFKNV